MQHSLRLAPIPVFSKTVSRLNVPSCCSHFLIGVQGVDPVWQCIIAKQMTRPPYSKRRRGLRTTHLCPLLIPKLFFTLFNILRIFRLLELDRWGFMYHTDSFDGATLEDDDSTASLNTSRPSSSRTPSFSAACSQYR